MDQKKQFILDYLTGKYTKKELCQAYGISRPTGDLLLKKYEQGGFTNLGDQRKTPHTNPYQTDPEVEAAILELRKQYPRWGARKLRVLLLEDWQADCVPSAQTIHKLLRRAGLVERKRRRHRFRPQQPVFDPEKAMRSGASTTKGSSVWAISATAIR
ncbi:helix-turn-helix domain-containing protein [Lewinella sp. IMCC34183]|uniref:helix-turn-helix domain-containing protein n=1 Tax=Lewinella sp. IMCC34183 TaxID=2248762 RepID=UPI00130039CD|nr:helix-turn-helix domain-containing protein [Lewinella sp. IMCC34183]